MQRSASRSSPLSQWLKSPIRPPSRPLPLPQSTAGALGPMGASGASFRKAPRTRGWPMAAVLFTARIKRKNSSGCGICPQRPLTYWCGLPDLTMETLNVLECFCCVCLSGRCGFGRWIVMF